MSVTIDNKGRRRHTVSTTTVIENQKVERRKEEIQREQEQAKSNERRLRLQ